MQSSADSVRRSWPRELAILLALVVVGSIILAVSGKIYVPFYPVHMTLQTLAIMVLAASCGARVGVLTVLAYLAEGALGLPVFTSTPPDVAGPLYFVGPTAGFLFGFVALAAIAGFAADRGWGRSVPRLLAALLVGEAVTFALGFAWLGWGLPLPSGGFGIGAAAAYAGGIAPFLLSEAFKIAIAALAVPAGRRLLAGFS